LKEGGRDAKPHAVDRKQYHELRHDVGNDERHEDGHKSEQDGSLEDLMTQFQQLLFCHSSTPAVLLQSSQQQLVAWSTSVHTSGPISASGSDTFEHQQDEEEQHRAAMDAYPMSSTSLPLLSRMNFLHPVALLEKALDAIPMSDKVELMTALQVAPRPVARELDPMRFLVFHDYNAQRAAEGLVYYWKRRREWFGDRAYLPMAMFSGGAYGGNNDGALTMEDICLFRSGFIVIVGTDRQGSPVWIMDSSRRNTTSAAARFRATFYAFQVLSEYHTSQRQGAVIIIIVQSNNLDKVSTMSMQMVMKTFPIKFKAVHSFDCIEKKNLFV